MAKQRIIIKKADGDKLKATLYFSRLFWIKEDTETGHKPAIISIVDRWTNRFKVKPEMIFGKELL